VATTDTFAGRRVLLAEDEYFIARAIARAFTTSGADILGPANSVEDALTLVVGAEHIDAAVLDINLQGKMVYPVADALAARGIPFVFATGYDAVSIPSRYAGVKCFTKPVDPVLASKALFG
jgi:CheY-like chemotaxis protein